MNALLEGHRPEGTRVSEADLSGKNAQFTTPADIARLMAEATNVASF